ncbi:MAG TPA: hypothetical protein VGV85_16210 [Longimicrobiaceae bacterium]|nr:hypothetical protein [Longimicrobiaceae bacterium]
MPKATGAATQRGASSVRKMASPTASGTAISSASSDEASVPKMNGSAPNCPSTGFHSLLARNPGPNSLSAGSAEAPTRKSRNASSRGMTIPIASSAYP